MVGQVLGGIGACDSSLSLTLIFFQSSMCPGMIFAMPLCTSEAVEKVKAKDYVWKVIKAATGKLF